MLKSRDFFLADNRGNMFPVSVLVTLQLEVHKPTASPSKVHIRD